MTEARARASSPALYAAAPAAVVALIMSAWIGINFDNRYVLGTLRVGTAGGVGGFADVFTHRPVAYRALVALLDAVPSRLPDATGPLAEMVIRLEALALVAAAAVLVARGVGRGAFGPVLGLALGSALALAPNWTFLEPDWVGALAAVAAVGAALAFRPAVAAPVAGLLLVATVAVKLTTAPYAVVAIGAVAALDRARAVRAGAWAAGLGSGWLLGTWLGQPVEWGWLRDMAALNPGSPLHVGLGGLDVHGFARSAANTLVVSPVLYGLPAALVVLVGAARHRLAAAAALTAAVTFTAVPVLVQAQWFLYQWAALPVLAAGLLVAAAAARRWDRATVIALTAPVALAGAASASVLTLPVDLREGRLVPVVALYLLFAVAAAVAAARRATPGAEARPAVGLVAGGLAAVLALGAAQLPGAGYSFTGYSAEITNAGLAARTAAERTELAAVRARIGPSTPVLYLAFGDIAYLLGNPTPCRYPSPVWLQRSTYIPGLPALASYRDNAHCITDPGPRWLVWERSWFDRTRVDPALDAELARRFDCARAITAPTPDVLSCPRRPGD